MIEIRATRPEERRATAVVVTMALMQAPLTDEDWDKRLSSWDGAASLSAWDGERCVGHVGAYVFDTTVPGGARLATAGVTRVGVLPTHRRQGLARRMMERLLTEAAESGQALASLRASESILYPRYGFGLAGVAAESVLRSRMAQPITGAAPGSMRVLHHDEVLDVVRPLYDRIAARPGAITRPDWLWTRYFEKAIELGGDAEFVAVHSDPDGTDDGYVHYSVKWREERGGLPQGEGEYYDLFGADDAVELALVDYLCNVDLVREWYAEERPIDDPAQLGVADWRAYQVKGRWDEQWLRLLDVDAALAARTYDDVGGAVTIAVTDTLLATNNGVWQVSASGAERTGVEADDAALAVDVRDLAAVYLGGTRWSQLAAVGRVGVADPAAVAIADRLFVSARAPFCCSGF